MSTLSQKRKRPYRKRVKCAECCKEIDSDYQEKHAKLHEGKLVQFSTVYRLDSTQTLVSGFFKKQTLNSSSEGQCVSTNIVSEACSSQLDTVTEICNTEESSTIPLDARLEIAQPCVSPSDASSGCNSDSDIESDIEDAANDSHLLRCTSNEDTAIAESHPCQPILTQYDRKKCGAENTTRDFNPEWYKTYPWLSYERAKRRCVCFPCQKFIDGIFQFTNWKKPERLKKHAKSSKHQLAMTKWIAYRVNNTCGTSVLSQMQSDHKMEVASNREYLKVIIQCLLYTAQQNIAQRGHVENRYDLDHVSDENRGNFLELLHLRCRDIPWLAGKLNLQLKNRAQWTSPEVQNEILSIVAKIVLGRIICNVQESKHSSIIVDETSDISRTEQVAVCVRYVVEGDTKESFVGFYSTPSTEGETLYELIKDVFRKLGLSLENVVAECFDGASNMSGVNRGLAARMKECSPLAIYIHCYGHLLNLAIQDTMTEIEPLRNALGSIQSLHNFIEGSPKRHAVFCNIDNGVQFVRTLKSQSVTRWCCRWEAVKSVFYQMPQIIKVLLKLANDRDSKTYSDSRSLLRAICDFEFVFGLVLLNVILSNTSTLSSYLQGKRVDVITARKTADATIETLNGCRNEECFSLTWKRAEVLSNEIKQSMEGREFSFKEAEVPRNRRPSLRLQALFGEKTCETDRQQTVSSEDHYRVSIFYPSLSRVTAEMKSRFDTNDQDLLCGLGDILFHESPKAESYDLIAKHYSVDKELLEAEQKIFMKFLATSDDLLQQAVTAPKIVEIAHKQGHHEVLPLFYKVASILATIPATSCSAERSFSTLRRMKTYLRSTMGQDRLHDLAIINVERAYTNEVINNYMDKIIDTFGERKGRKSLFF